MHSVINRTLATILVGVAQYIENTGTHNAVMVFFTSIIFTVNNRTCSRIIFWIRPLLEGIVIFFLMF